jgi:hypothetical protein
MNKLLNVFGAVSAASFLVGCVPIRYSEYTGRQTVSYLGTWQTGQGTMAETSYALPVYRGWPEKEYKVLGSLSFPDPNKTWDEGIIRAAARTAKEHKADAIIIRQGAEFGVSTIAGARPNPRVVAFSYQSTALAIRWATAEEIKQLDNLVDELLARRSLVQANREVAQLIVSYVLGSGVPDSQRLAKCIEIESRLEAGRNDTMTGDWIFKATDSMSTSLSSGDEKIFVGIATVTQDSDNLSVVSSGGGIEMNFAGTLSKSKVTGQLGMGSVSAKCEGAATPEKISITFQTLTPDGTVRGNVVLQRLPKPSNK